MGTGFFPSAENGRDVILTPHIVLVPWWRKNRANPVLPCGTYILYRAWEFYKCALYFLYGITQRSKINYNQKTRSTDRVWRGRYLWTNCGQQLRETKKCEVTNKLKYIKC